MAKGTPDPHADLFAEADGAMRELQRLSRRAVAFRTAPTARDRVALIDDLTVVRSRLAAARDAVGRLLQRNGAANAALAAYRRTGAIRANPVSAGASAGGRRP